MTREPQGRKVGRQSKGAEFEQISHGWGFFALAVTATKAGPAQMPSDAEIRREIIGSWIVPSDSGDFGPENKYALETFRPDGTYIFDVFGDAACTAIIQHIQVKYLVENGVLTSLLADGSKLRDQVIEIGNGKMTLHSLDDGTTYTRAKALTCSKALSS